MSPELQKYYEDRLEMMSGSAWKELIVDLTKMREYYENIRSCDTNNIEFRKGQVDILDYIIGLRELSETAYEDLNEKNI
jgi:hypothetical protein